MHLESFVALAIIAGAPATGFFIVFAELRRRGSAQVSAESVIAHNDMVMRDALAMRGSVALAPEDMGVGRVVVNARPPSPERKKSRFTLKLCVVVESVSLVVILYIDRAYSIFPGMLEMIAVAMIFLRLNPSAELYDTKRYDA